MRYVIRVTTRDGVFLYSATRGLLPALSDESWAATRFDSRDGVDVAVRLLQKRHSDWFVQRKNFPEKY